MLTRVDIKFLGHFAAKYVAFLGIKKKPASKKATHYCRALCSNFRYTQSYVLCQF